MVSGATARTVNLGGGVVVPYPEPTSVGATNSGKGNRRVDSKPEKALRSALHAMGLRYRVDLLVRAGDVRTHPDIVFTKRKVAVFVDGCFWHGCPEHGTTPKSNTSYWGPKLQKNVERDVRVTSALREDGWRVVRVWEHEDLDSSLALVAEALRASTTTDTPPR